MKPSIPHWQPTASFSHLRLRAKLLTAIRQFFSKRSVLEIETPLLSQHTVTDCHIESFSTDYKAGNSKHTYYLQTSPEYAMKRLLAAGSGPIFQICKAFRNGETGRQHNPEFTLLEWYQPNYDHHKLMDEIDEFLQSILKTKPAERKSYQTLFQEYLAIDPLQCELKQCQQLLEKHHLGVTHIAHLDSDTCLQLLLSHLIEPQLGHKTPLFLYDFPSTQAALAKIRPDSPPVAERFELYIQGTEIAYGFHELTDANEQKKRFAIYCLSNYYRLR